MFFVKHSNSTCSLALWNIKKNVNTAYKEKCEPVNFLISIDWLWTAIEVDKKKQLTLLALICNDIHIRNQKKNVLTYSTSIMNCPDSSIGNKAKRFPEYVCCTCNAANIGKV